MKTCVSLALPFFLFASCCVCHGQAAKHSFSLSVQAPEPVIRTGSDVKLIVTMTNISDRDIRIARFVGDDLLEAHYRVDVRDEEGTLVPDTEHGRMVHGKGPNRPSGSIVSGVLRPGQKLEERSF